MKNILFLNFNSKWMFHFTTKLEIIKNLIKNGDNVYTLSCNEEIDGGCVANRNCEKIHCKRCRTLKNAGLAKIKFPKEKELFLENFEVPQFPEFKDLQDLKTYKIGDFNIGFGVANNCMFRTRDYILDAKRNAQYIKKSLRLAYLIYKNIDKIVKEKNIDEIYIFNGRFAECWAGVSYCVNNNITYYLHERGAHSDNYEILKNKMFHNLQSYKDEVVKYWEQGSSNKIEIARHWFELKKTGNNWCSYTKKQKKGLLPPDFDTTKEKIAIFNSSLDEYIVFDDWQNPIAKTENELIFKLFDYFRQDDSKHFFLRIHPNLTNINTNQMKEIKNYAKNKPDNLTIIMPEDVIDTYSLIEQSDKILTFTSTVGVEGCYWGKPVILAGRAIYEDLDVAYKARDFNHLVQLLNSQLEPKPQENAYPYGYWSEVYGREFKNFRRVDYEYGYFCGINALTPLKLKFSKYFEPFKICK